MTPRQIELVQNSFAKIVPFSPAAADVFYKRLFQMDPSLRALFTSDVKQQGKKLMESIRAVVLNLRRIDQIIAGVQAMAARHAPHATQSHHYATVGGAWMHTLAKGLGDEFTEEMREAWLTAATLLAISMKAAADEAAADAVAA